MAPLYSDLVWGIMRAPADRDEARINAAIVRAGDYLAMADATLATQPWLSGGTFAMGDIPLGSLVYAWYELPIQRPDLPHLAEWYARLRERPAPARRDVAADVSEGVRGQSPFLRKGIRPR